MVYKDRIIKRILLLINTSCLILFISNSSLAFNPEFVHQGNGVYFLNLEIESYYDVMETRYEAIVCGAEMWFEKYSSYIRKYCCYDYSYYWVYQGQWVPITAENLASMLWEDSELAARDFQPELENILVTAMEIDKANHSYWGSGWWKNPGDKLDVYGDWKWRSIWMEARWEEKMAGAIPFLGNCYGTADYLTRGTAWITANGIGWSGEPIAFPYIYLNNYNIENDLFQSGNFMKIDEFVVNNANSAANFWNVFDLAYGTNHSYIYLCTNYSGHARKFQKYGPDPYELLNANYLTQFRGIFFHNGTNKQVITDNWDIDWSDNP